MFNSAVSVSISTLYYSLYYFLVNHPLLNNGLVKHTLTQEPIEISQYRLMGGFPLNDGLTCSIYPLFNEDNLTSPATINTSVLHSVYQTGVANEDQSVFHFIIDYSYRGGVNVEGNNKIEDETLIRVPKNHVVFPQDIGKVNNQTKSVDLYVNPSLDIVCQYLALTRLALLDVSHTWNFPLGPTYTGTLGKIEILHENLPTIPWEKGTSIIDTRGYLLIRMYAYLSRDWRKMWQFPLEEINLDISLQK